MTFSVFGGNNGAKINVRSVSEEDGILYLKVEMKQAKAEKISFSAMI